MCSKLARKLTGSSLGKFGRKYMDPLSRKLADSVDSSIAPGPDGQLNASQQQALAEAEAANTAAQSLAMQRRKRRAGSLVTRGVSGSPGGRGAAGSALSSGGVSSTSALGYAAPNISGFRF